MRCVSSSKLACNIDSPTNINYTFSDQNIAWPSDKQKFLRSQYLTNPDLTARISKELVPPEEWRTAWPDIYGKGYTAANLPDLNTWERFQVWMRTAGLPTFRKLWGRNDGADLVAAIYEITITDSTFYPAFLDRFQCGAIWRH